MAFLGQDDKQNQQNQNPSQQGPSGSSDGQVSGAGTTPLVGTGTNAVSAAPSLGQSAPGAGGGGGWTNIQSYLTANQGNTNASDTLSKQVGGQFAQDKSNIQDQSKQLQDQSSQSAHSNYLAPDQASQMLQQASNMYGGANPSAPPPTYGIPENGNQRTAAPKSYSDIVGTFRNDLNNPWSGPQANFNPTLSYNTTQYGQALGDDNATNAMMNQLYNTQSGVNLNPGQANLQGVLQQNDPKFQQTRQDLQGQYGQMNPWLQQQSQQTNQAITDAQGQYTGNQKTLHDYLTGSQGTNKSAIDQAVTNWNNTNSNYTDPVTGAQSSAMNTANQQLMAALTAAQAQSMQIPGGVNIADPTSGNFNTPYALWAQQSGQEYPSINLNNYINPGVAANASNVQGVNDQRSHFNTIADIFGSGGQIAQSSTGPTALSANIAGLKDFINQGATNEWNHLNQGNGTNNPVPTWNW